MKQDKNERSKYIKITNPREEIVSKILSDGYLLHSVTPIVYGREHKLVYHFIFDEYRACEYDEKDSIREQLICELGKRREELELDRNPFLDFRDEE
jgi:hypothetical protein